jgi:acetone carboxylase, gamma subunit
VSASASASVGAGAGQAGPVQAATEGQRPDQVVIAMTEYLGIGVSDRHWHCRRCDYDLGPARRSYKEGCLIADRDPREVHPAIGPGAVFNFSFDPRLVRLLEFYCPRCATLIETEYLPPGHPLTWDIEVDVDALIEMRG